MSSAREILIRALSLRKLQELLTYTNTKELDKLLKDFSFLIQGQTHQASFVSLLHHSQLSLRSPCNLVNFHTAMANLKS